MTSYPLSQVVCEMLMQASRLVPLSQEHLFIKLCQLIHQLLNQLQVLTLWPYMASYQEAQSSEKYPAFLLPGNSGWAYTWCVGVVLLSCSAHMQLMDSPGCVARPLVTGLWQWIQMSTGKSDKSGNSHLFFVYDVNNLIILIL